MTDTACIDIWSFAPFAVFITLTIILKTYRKNRP